MRKDENEIMDEIIEKAVEEIVETKPVALGSKVKIKAGIDKDLNGKEISNAAKIKTFIVTMVYENANLIALENEKYKLRGESLEIVK